MVKICAKKDFRQFVYTGSQLFVLTQTGSKQTADMMSLILDAMVEELMLGF